MRKYIDPYIYKFLIVNNSISVAIKLIHPRNVLIKDSNVYILHFLSLARTRPKLKTTKVNSVLGQQRRLRSRQLNTEMEKKVKENFSEDEISEFLDTTVSIAYICLGTRRGFVEGLKALEQAGLRIIFQKNSPEKLYVTKRSPSETSAPQRAEEVDNWS